MAKKKLKNDGDETLTENKAPKKKKKKSRNRELWIITYVFIACMLAVIGNEIYFVYAESETAVNNSYNPRQELLASKNIRGQILSAEGETLAQTVRGEDGNEERLYPYGPLFSHVVGYSTRGKTGVEYLGNMALLNSNAAFGEKIQNELTSQKNIGDNVITTLDVDVQKEAYAALGVYDGAIIVTEPSTGRIIAMVSKPDFDPNEIADIWDELVADDSSSVLLNRATQGLYPPGSTFKMVTALAYYRQNDGDVSGYHYQCGGSLTNNGHRINCYHGSSHGSLDFQKSFEKSCNSSFANIGLSLKLEGLEDTCEDMLFNKKLGLPIITSQGSYVLGTEAGDYDIMQTVIGQGKTQITPLQLNMITSAVANDGIAMKPYVIDRIENYNGGIVKKYEPEKYATLMTPEEATFLSGLMEGVVENGTATRLRGLSYTAAGKTGSAEFSEDKSDSHAWFTGYAPVDNPQVCVTIIVEGAGSGGEYAVPIAKRVFDAYFSR